MGKYRCSEFTVNDVIEKLPSYIKLSYNGVVLFDDTDTNPTPESPNGIQYPYKHPDFDVFLENYVSDFDVEIVHFHHFIINIRGYKDV